MTLNKKLVLTLVLVLILLAVTSCGGDKGKTEVTPPADSSSSTENTETEVPEETPPAAPAEETTVTEEVEAPEETAAEAPAEEPVETVDASTRENPAELGEWVATKQNGKDMELGDIRYRVTSISDDQEAIMALINAYNDDDDNFIKIDTEVPEDYILKMCDYEVVYEKGFPGYGDNGDTIYSPDLYFSIDSEDGGGLDTADGYSHIGIRVIDISPGKRDSIQTGETFQGRIVFGIPNNVIEQYFVASSYSDKDEDENPITVYSYVKVEEIKAE